MVTFTLQAASIRRLRSPLSPTSASRRSGKEEFLVEGQRPVGGGVRVRIQPEQRGTQLRPPTLLLGKPKRHGGRPVRLFHMADGGLGRALWWPHGSRG